MKTKKCCRKTCINQNPQPIENFHKNKHRKDGLSAACKDCRLKEANDYYDRNREDRLLYAKESYNENPQKILNRNKNWRDKNPDKKAECNRNGYRKWYSKEENKVKKAEYTQEHKDEKREYDREYIKDREKIDLNYRIRKRLRTRMSMALKKGYKSGSAVRDLGCSIEEFLKYIESFWNPGMTWDNYGNKKGQWSLDHTIPLSKFDLTDRTQFLKACNYTNIRPMWHLDNMKKHNKVSK